MTKVLGISITNGFAKHIKRRLGDTPLRAIAISLLFVLSGISASVLINPASASPNAAPASPAALSPVSQAAANWAAPNGNAFAQDYNPQNQINSSNAQNLGLKWIFPIPTEPAALLSIPAQGTDTAPMVINGTIYMITNFAQVFALNAANGNVLWNDLLPIYPNSTSGIPGVGKPGLHLHDGSEWFTTKLFGGKPTLWFATPDLKVWAINAATGAYELNFSRLPGGAPGVAGSSPNAIESTTAANIMVDQNRGIAITSANSGSSAQTARCFYRGWNVLVSPPKLLWTAFCSPPQPGGNLTVSPTWEISQVNNMSSAEIFYPGPSYNSGGYIPGTAVVNLKTLPSNQLNSTLYNDWGYTDQSASCAALSAGYSTGSTSAGWGGAWLLGTGPTDGMAFVNTNNRDPYASPCETGPGLWAAAMLALNETTGAWIWGFQTSAHDSWDYDCSWWQAMGNETVNGATTQVIYKICKSGYLFELNAKTGALIWAWTPPPSLLARCANCYLFNPLNATQMSFGYFAGNSPDVLAANHATLCTPCSFAFELEGSYDPATNYIYVVSDNNPRLTYYVPFTSANWASNPGWAQVGPQGQGKNEGTFDNCTVEAVNGATGQMAWSYFVPSQGFRGGITASGNLLYIPLSSGDILMLDATKGTKVNDLYIGGPLNQLPVLGATIQGTEELIVPISAGAAITWAPQGAVPGDIVALTLSPTLSANTTGSASQGGATVTSTVTSTVTATASGSGASGGGTGYSATTVYGIAAVAVIFIIATGYLAMTRSRRPPA
jgi:hypothetical protein